MKNFWLRATLFIHEGRKSRSKEAGVETEGGKSGKKEDAGVRIGRTIPR